MLFSDAYCILHILRTTSASRVVSRMDSAKEYPSWRFCSVHPCTALPIRGKCGVRVWRTLRVYTGYLFIEFPIRSMEIFSHLPTNGILVVCPSLFATFRLLKNHTHGNDDEPRRQHTHTRTGEAPSRSVDRHSKQAGRQAKTTNTNNTAKTHTRGQRASNKQPSKHGANTHTHTHTQNGKRIQIIGNDTGQQYLAVHHGIQFIVPHIPDRTESSESRQRQHECREGARSSKIENNVERGKTQRQTR